MILANTANNAILGGHGNGSKRLFCMYCGINVNLNKLARVMGSVLGEFILSNEQYSNRVADANEKIEFDPKVKDLPSLFPVKKDD